MELLIDREIIKINESDGFTIITTPDLLLELVIFNSEDIGLNV